MSVCFSWTQQCMWTHACICTAAYQLNRGSLQCVTPWPTMAESVPSNTSSSHGGLLPYVVRKVKYIAVHCLFEIMQQYILFLDILTTVNRTFTVFLQNKFYMQFKLNVNDNLFSIYRSRLSQGSSIFRLCVLLPS